MTSISASRALVVILLAGAAGFGCTAGVAPTTTASSSGTAVPAAADTVLVASDAWSPRPGTVFELFSIGGGSQPSRLTYCTGCQTLSGVPSLDRNRIAVRRVTTDTNGDGKLDESDRVTLLLIDLARGVEGPFLPEGWSTNGADWSADGTFLVHTSSPDGRTDGLYTIDSNAQNNQAIIGDPTSRVRSGRLNASMSRAIYERFPGLGAGKSEIWTGASASNQTKITDGGTVGELLPGTLYLVGSDAGPDFSPDGNGVVFRRLTSTSVAGGAWDILVSTSAGGTPRVIASGPQFRSAPDWGKDGIVFSEQNLTTGGTDVVVIDATTLARRVLHSFGSGYKAGAPRWIAG